MAPSACDTLDSVHRFAGCLVGQCVGDALGFVVEGAPPAACRRYVEGSLRRGRLDELRRGPFPPGQYSDDSQLARELALSIVDRGGFVAEDYARRIAALFAESRVVGGGRATEEAARRLADGVPWHEAGTPPPAAGNGSAMRAAPVGLLHGEDPEELVRTAYDQGRITHRDPRCAAGAVAIAGATALALRPGRLDAAAFALELAEWTRVFDHALSDALTRMRSWLESTPEDVAREIARAGRQDDVDAGWEGISPFVSTSVLWSLYAFLRSPDDYWEAVCTAIAVGGDVDTTAAMTGAVAGARVGLDGIPAEAARRIADRGRWGYAEIVALAHRLHDVVRPASRERGTGRET